MRLARNCPKVPKPTMPIRSLQRQKVGAGGSGADGQAHGRWAALLNAQPERRAGSISVPLPGMSRPAQTAVPGPAWLPRLATSARRSRCCTDTGDGHKQCTPRHEHLLCFECCLRSWASRSNGKAASSASTCAPAARSNKKQEQARVGLLRTGTAIPCSTAGSLCRSHSAGKGSSAAHQDCACNAIAVDAFCLHREAHCAAIFLPRPPLPSCCPDGGGRLLPSLLPAAAHCSRRTWLRSAELLFRRTGASVPTGSGEGCSGGVALAMDEVGVSGISLQPTMLPSKRQQRVSAIGRKMARPPRGQLANGISPLARVQTLLPSNIPCMHR